MKRLISYTLMSTIAFDASAAEAIMNKQTIIDELLNFHPSTSISGLYRSKKPLSKDRGAGSLQAVNKTPELPSTSPTLLSANPSQANPSQANTGSSTGSPSSKYPMSAGSLPNQSISYRFGVNGNYASIKSTLLLLNDAPGPAPVVPFTMDYTLATVAPGLSLFGSGIVIDLLPYANLPATITQLSMVSARSTFPTDAANEVASTALDIQNRLIYSSSGATTDQIMLLLGYSMSFINCVLFGAPGGKRCGLPPEVVAYKNAMNQTLNTILQSPSSVMPSPSGVLPSSVLPSPYSVMSLAGAPNQSGYANGLTPSSMFGVISGITSDGTQLYVSDKTNGLIRSISSETTTTINSDPAIPSIAINRDVGVLSSTTAGNIKTTQSGVSLALPPNGAATSGAIPAAQGVTVVPPSNSIDGIGKNASFLSANGVVATKQSLFVVDGNVIRKIDLATKSVKTLSGSGNNGYVDGSPASFGNLTSIATDGTDLYVTDESYNVVRRVNASTGVASTLAGLSSYYAAGGFADGAANVAQFNVPSGVATNGVSVFVADTSNSVIRKIDLATGAVSTLAGKAKTSGYIDGIGAAALFTVPRAIAIEGDRLFVADGDRIRRISLKDASVTTIAGSAPGFADGIGLAAQFSSPTAITSDGKDLYVADGNFVVRVIIDGAK